VENNPGIGGYSFLLRETDGVNVDGTPMRAIWPEEDGRAVAVIDQTKLPHALEVARLATVEDAAVAIEEMVVRGAPLIGATAAYGIALGLLADPSDLALDAGRRRLIKTRPTAANLRWALNEVSDTVRSLPESARADAAFARAGQICDDDVAICSSIGDHGLGVIEEIWERKGKRGVINLLTHCNAGWLATVDWGTATAPIYKAHAAGIPLHVWVDETRPRNQGASLTAWELGNNDVPYTLIVDNAGGHLMQHGMVDLCLVGSDRTTAKGDVANKIGTYLKALAANDNGVPFYVALPSPTIDWTKHDGLEEIPIEQRSPDEVTHITGRDAAGLVVRVGLAPDGAAAANYGFDVTPARLVTGLITERGVCEANEEALASLFPDLT
jgi:methylthioribose-1-phosphate isomerase